MTEDATSLTARVRSGQRTVASVVGEALERLAASSTGGLAALDPSAMERARALDRRGPIGPLHGCPVVLKDNLLHAGRVATCGSRVLEGYRSPYDATVVARLEAAGAVIVGRAHMDELGMGSSGESCAWGPVRNPHDAARVPGGSSSGCAALVAEGAVPVALGSDTGGSVRQPAALCGVVGLRPTWGRVSRHGLVAFASSLDQVGPITRSVRDAARVLRVIAGVDPRDPTTREVPDQRVVPTAVALPDLTDDEVHPDVLRAVSEAASALEATGVRVRRVPALDGALGVGAYLTLATTELVTNLARFDGARFGPDRGGSTWEERALRARTLGFGPEVRRRLLAGAWVHLHAHADDRVGRARGAAAHLREAMLDRLEGVDALLLPTTAAVARRCDAPEAPDEALRGDRFTIPAALAGLPAISVPFGTDAAGMPIGLQLIGRPDDEATCLAVAERLESLRTPRGSSPSA